MHTPLEDPTSCKKATSQACNRARQATAQLKQVAAQVKPPASSAGRQDHSAQNAGMGPAPRVERTGQVLEHSVAPKVSA